MRPSGRAQLSWAQRTSVREPQLEPEMRRQSPAQRQLRAPFGRTAQPQTRNTPPEPSAASTTFVIRQNNDNLAEACVWGGLAGGVPVEKGDALFPRLQKND